MSSPSQSDSDHLHISDISYSLPKQYVKGAGYIEKVLLNQIDFHIQSNELCGIMGASGTGKSTLFDLLAGRKRTGKWSGNICYNNHHGVAQLWNNTSYVLQHELYFPLLTVEETLLFTAWTKMNQDTALIQRQAHVEYLLNIMNLDHIRHNLVGGDGNSGGDDANNGGSGSNNAYTTVRGISGGERKRLSIAMSLIMLPKVLLLDEPTTGLDSINAYEVMKSIKQLLVTVPVTISSTPFTNAENSVVATADLDGVTTNDNIDANRHNKVNSKCSNHINSTTVNNNSTPTVHHRPHSLMIISTIHQPSQEIFSLFDKILLLMSDDNSGGGRKIYFGPTNRVVEYFTQPLLEYRFSHHHNNNSNDNVKENVNANSSSSNSATSHNNNNKANETNTNTNSNPTAMNPAEFIMRIATQNITATPLPRVIKEEEHNDKLVSNPSVYDDVATVIIGTKRTAMELSHLYRQSEYYCLYATSPVVVLSSPPPTLSSTVVTSHSQALPTVTDTATSIFIQLRMLITRSFLLFYYRDYINIFTQVGKNALLSTLISLVFYQQGALNEPLFIIMSQFPIPAVQSVNSGLFFIMTYCLISNIQEIGGIYRSELMYRQELNNRTYTSFAYWLTSCIIHLPILLLNHIVFLSCIFVLVGFPSFSLLYLFIIFFITLWISSYYAQCLVYLLRNLKLVLILYPTTFIVLNNFAGFSIPIKNIPVVWIWGPWLSYTRWVYQGLILHIYSHYTSNTSLSEGGSGNGLDIIRSLGFSCYCGDDGNTINAESCERTSWWMVGVLGVYIIVLAVISYIALLPFSSSLQHVDDVTATTNTTIVPPSMSSLTTATTTATILSAPLLKSQQQRQQSFNSLSTTKKNNKEKMITSAAAVVTEAEAELYQPLLSPSSSSTVTAAASNNHTVGTDGDKCGNAMAIQIYDDTYASSAVDSTGEIYSNRMGCRLLFKDISYYVPDTNTAITNESAADSHIPSSSKCLSSWFYYKRTSKMKTARRAVLSNVSGRVLPNEICAVMGASGSGKTTLLDILAGRKRSSSGSGFGSTSGGNVVMGEVYINGVAVMSNNNTNNSDNNNTINRCFDNSYNFGKMAANIMKLNPHHGHRYCAYVTQDSILMNHLTVHETIYYATHLRLPHHLSSAYKQQQIQKILTLLKLLPCQHTSVNSLSGGEWKRVALAVEMVDTTQRASLLLVDEPTSGLDSAMAYDIITCIKNIAKKYHKTVICTIHQPSIHTFLLFDTLLLISSRGQAVYFGSVSSAVGYFIQDCFPRLLLLKLKEDEEKEQQYHAESSHNEITNNNTCFTDPPATFNGTAATDESGNNNPAEFLVLVASGKYTLSSSTPTLATATATATSTTPLTVLPVVSPKQHVATVEELHSLYTESEIYHNLYDRISQILIDDKQLQQQYVADAELSQQPTDYSNYNCCCFCGDWCRDSEIRHSTAYTPLHGSSSSLSLSSCLISRVFTPLTHSCHQTFILSCRLYRQAINRPRRYFYMLLRYLFIALFYGSLFYQLSTDDGGDGDVDSNILNQSDNSISATTVNIISSITPTPIDFTIYTTRLSLLFFLLLFVITSHMQIIPTMFEHRALYYHECKTSSLYGAVAYWLATLCIDVPFCIITLFLFAIIVYFLTGLRLNDESYYLNGYYDIRTYEPFFLFYLIVLLASLTGYFLIQCLSALSPSLNLAIGLYPLLLFVFLIFAGFIIFLPTLPMYLSIWGPKISFIRFALQALVLNEFSNNDNDNTNLNDINNRNNTNNKLLLLPYSEVFIEMLGFDSLTKYQCMRILCIFMMVFAFCTVLALKYVMYDKK